MSLPPENGWGVWSKHVLAELERLNAEIAKLHETGRRHDIEVAMLKVKATVWGALGAMVPVAVMILLQLFR